MAGRPRRNTAKRLLASAAVLTVTIGVGLASAAPAQAWGGGDWGHGTQLAPRTEFTMAPDGSSGATQGGDGIPNIAQIKLLKLLQIELNGQTDQLAAVKTKNGKWTADEQKRFEQLSKRQGRLADLVRDLTSPAEDEPEPPEEK